MTRNHNLTIAQKHSFVCARCGDVKHASAFAMQVLDGGDMIRSDTCAACGVEINAVREGFRKTEVAAAAARNEQIKNNAKAAKHFTSHSAPISLPPKQRSHEDETDTSLRGCLPDQVPFVVNSGHCAGRLPATCVQVMAA